MNDALLLLVFAAVIAPTVVKKHNETVRLRKKNRQYEKEKANGK